MFVRTDPDQPNLIDGTILAFDPREGGAYVTFAGLDGPVIASIDTADLVRLGTSILNAVNHFDPEKTVEEQARLTTRGVEILKAELDAGRLHLVGAVTGDE
jgi:hypothetical protein